MKCQEKINSKVPNTENTLQDCRTKVGIFRQMKTEDICYQRYGNKEQEHGKCECGST